MGAIILVLMGIATCAYMFTAWPEPDSAQTVFGYIAAPALVLMGLGRFVRELRAD